VELFVCGLSHKTAPLEIRESLAFTGRLFDEGLAHLLDFADEAVLLSTCNRTEVYAVAQQQEHVLQAVRGLVSAREIPWEDAESHIYLRSGTETVIHLFRVSSGLESMVLGESQVLGQVRDAYEASATRGAIKALGHALFRAAIAAGKRVHRETEVGRGASLSNRAVDVLGMCLGTLQDRTVLVVGGGLMGQLAARHLRERGIGTLAVISRDQGRASEVARAFGGEAAGFDRLVHWLALSDGVISSTGAPHPVIRRHHLEGAGARRGYRPLPVVDIAVPRDVEPGIEDLKWLHLVNVDGLALPEGSLDEEYLRAEAIVIAEAEAFLAWLSHRRMAAPAISHLLERIERLRLQELDRLHRKAGGFTPAQSRHVAAFSHRILDQVLHEPLVRMRELAASGDLEGLRLIAEAFGAGEEQ
jgi:glutamyl-tRNA reductase